MSLTFEVSHEDRSALKELAFLNMPYTLFEEREQDSMVRNHHFILDMSPHK